MKFIKGALPLLVLWFVAVGRAACHRPDTERHHVSTLQCPPKKEKANEARVRFRMPADHGDRLEMIQGSQWTRHRVTYRTLCIDFKKKGKGVERCKIQGCKTRSLE